MPHTLRPGHRDKPFIIVSAFSISTLVKGPWTAGMQRAVALRSYHHSLRVYAALTSLLSSLQEDAWQLGKAASLRASLQKLNALNKSGR